MNEGKHQASRDIPAAATLELRLLQAFMIQFHALRSSAANFDKGEIWEVVRMANAMFILLAPPGGGICILDQMKRNTLAIPTTCGNKPGGSSLVVCTNGPARRVDLFREARATWLEPVGYPFKPVRDRPEQMIGIPKSEWWTQIVIEANGFSFNRLEIVKYLRHRGGGAHYDENPTDPKFEKPLFFEYTLQGETIMVPRLLEATTRQIAFETILGLMPIHEDLDNTINFTDRQMRYNF